ncbi:hypothetical protein AB0442_42240, partial [Kitasatospora sp. NPDC085895]|uniref:hypothetical protein n=1 Tax=Kitasatospora sp. NPDC085895 TaxID=3155057 RepID=UPI00344BB6AD
RHGGRGGRAADRAPDPVPSGAPADTAADPVALAVGVPGVDAGEAPLHSGRHAERRRLADAWLLPGGACAELDSWRHGRSDRWYDARSDVDRHGYGHRDAVAHWIRFIGRLALADRDGARQLLL